MKDILKALEDKYELTKKEKFENLVDMIKQFKPNKTDSGEKIFSQIEKINKSKIRLFVVIGNWNLLYHNCPYMTKLENDYR